MEWGTPVYWGWFLLFSRCGGHKTKETHPTRPGSPTPCKQGLNQLFQLLHLVHIQLISKKVVGKSAHDNPKGIVGGFEFTVLRRSLNE